MILFEITLRQTSLSFKQMFLQRPENINVLWGSRHNKQVTALSCAFCRPLMSALLLRKLTNVPHEWSPITVNKRHRGTRRCKTAQNVSSRCPLQSTTLTSSRYKTFFNAAESAGGVKTVSHMLSSWGQTDTLRNFIVITEKRSYSFRPVIH